jgi:gluconolactonase
MELISEGLQFPEGPIACSSGSIMLVEIARGTLSEVAVDSGGIRVVADCGGGPNGAAVGPNRQIYICNNGGFSWATQDGFRVPRPPDPEQYMGGRIQRVDPATGSVVDVYDQCGSHPLRGPNDLVFDGEGGFWFTDVGKTWRREMQFGGLYYAQADGSGIREVVFPLMTPNGVGLSPAGDRVYVAETVPGRVWAWDIPEPGQVIQTGPGPGGGHLLWGFDGFQALDSMAVEETGNVCVATLVRGAISVISPTGALVEQVFLPEYDYFVTNICFGGVNERTAFITSSGRGRLYATTWGRPGVKLAYSL